MDEAGTTSKKKSWRCRFGMHDYHTMTNDEGARYLVCSRCHREEDPGSSFNVIPS